ncbi:NADH-quinone oxidoreductase subunit NuoG [Wenzhouxiangella sediminis]|uniref:NADH-quinone oxidoreductase n=1 Tax=Wenzhouxiangella sediminis TaxID=1792836 RepID=A0A3E1KCK3_9GAMM|nr:NADH-quinone oxidoreductase subunit NuoG [Wenzhouxiangella sediminis]RFF32608.1 NADH-quinone oxidoreductase subunit G [Wenzhouxiangella sediminis]
MATAQDNQTDTVTIEVDGQELTARKGEMIIQVTDRAGIDIPRFCYHSKLSIAANCRMCLVDVEKAPKPLPACATPVADGMKVFTESRRTVDAQRGVMEFLLINHPLDCPICDQGGECELQDLAMGYGRSVSRFTERKRVVRDKNVGPLIETDMTRCIHCTRCVRFLEEIAGTCELGGMSRGEHMEIGTFVERNINSELSGNVIDLCPVGALTNKPFRHTARPWEMRARKYVGTHDCLGSHLHYHTRGPKIMRAVPRDNEAVNECWLSDRDRYSHFGLRSEDRLTSPQVKVDGQWREASWSDALDAAARALKGAVETHGGSELGVLVSPRATTEEHYLAAAMARSLGSENVDHRLRLLDFTHPQAGRAHLDVPTAKIAESDAILLVGSNIRHEQPILGHRVRTAWRQGGAKIADINSVAWDFHFDLAERMIVPPQAMVDTFARVAKAAADLTGAALPEGKLGEYIAARQPEHEAKQVAGMLKDAASGVLLLGDQALNHPEAGWLRRLAEWLAEALEVALVVLPGPANSAGAWTAGSVPGRGGLNARSMISKGRQAYLLWDIEPDFDLADPAAARRALEGAASVVAATTFDNAVLRETADVLLPLSPAPEVDGTWINADGHRDTLQAVGRAPEQSRAGWKILRKLGELAGAEGFDFATLDAVTRQALENDSAEAAHDEAAAPFVAEGDTLWRTGEVPIYSGDNILRRAPALQQTTHAAATVCAVHPTTARRHGLEDAERVRVRQGEASAELDLVLDERVAPGAVGLPVATCPVSTLGAGGGEISLEALS